MANTLKYDAPTAAIDLTAVATNVKAVPLATPRVGGFVLRNRFSGALAITMARSCVTGSDVDINQITVLDVPKRTMIRGINLYAVESETVPSHAFAYAGTAASIANNDQNTDLAFIAQPYKDPSQSTLDSVSASLTLGTILLDAATAAGSAIKGTFTSTPIVNVDSSTANATKAGIAVVSSVTANAVGAGSFSYPRYFPHGGKVLLALTGSVCNTNADVNHMSAKCSGVWEVQAECEYVPV